MAVLWVEEILSLLSLFQAIGKMGVLSCTGQLCFTDATCLYAAIAILETAYTSCSSLQQNAIWMVGPYRATSRESKEILESEEENDEPVNQITRKCRLLEM